MITQVSQDSTIHSVDKSGFKVPAGKYWIGDPSYVLTKNDFSNFVHQDKNNGSIGCILDGHIIIALSTFFGDGEYYDDEQNSYKVDSGYIGIIPLDYLTLNNIDVPENGRIHIFEKTSEIFVSDIGLMNFGNITITT